MSFGCTGPFKRGSGGVCGCECKCCPPPCFGIVAVLFDCGGPFDPTINPEGCDFNLPFSPFNLPPPQEIPKFSDKPVLSADGRFILGPATLPCSVPCQTVCVPIKCGGMDCPCCCIEICDGKILSVGNGYVTAPPTVELEGCLTFTVLINGLPPPVFVCDAQEIVVTICSDPADPCCRCEPIGIQPGCCPTDSTIATGFAPMRKRPLFRRKIDPMTGKLRINPRTGRPIIVMDKLELIRRVQYRKKKLLRKKR